MKNKIPNVNFNHANSLKGFEIMSLREFSLKVKNTNISHSPNEPHRLKFYIMLYVVDGVGEHRVDFNVINLKKGSLVFISPEQVHAFEKNLSYEGYLCLFTKEFLQNEFLNLQDRYIVDHLYLKDITKALVLEDSSMEDFFHLLQKEFFALSVHGKSGVITALLRAILIKSSEHFDESSKDNEKSELFDNFKKALLQNFSEIRQAEEYASLLKVSPKHLNLTCKQLTGLTTKAFIDRFMIVEAKRYLVSSTLPIKEIAFKMGYNEVSNFVKFFKKHVGLTPKAFKDSQNLT